MSEGNGGCAVCLRTVEEALAAEERAALARSLLAARAAGSWLAMALNHHAGGVVGADDALGLALRRQVALLMRAQVAGAAL